VPAGGVIRGPNDHVATSEDCSGVARALQASATARAQHLRWHCKSSSHIGTSYIYSTLYIYIYIYSTLYIYRQVYIYWHTHTIHSRCSHACDGTLYIVGPGYNLLIARCCYRLDLARSLSIYVGLACSQLAGYGWLASAVRS
jgi:hypothetical protein